jgi:hypothetical protein
MATLNLNTLDGSMATDAEFRAIADFISDVFGLGWVQTSDTGQINLTTVARPGATNTSAGYQVWRMDDTLQATKPVYLKIEYGTGGSTAVASIWVTIGTGSDGAGNITGTFQNRQQITAVTANVATGDSFGSAANNRITFAVLATLATAFWFSCERTKDNTGADTGDGLILGWGSASSNHKSRCVYFAGSNPTEETGLQFILSTLSPSTFGTDTGIGIMIPMRGIAMQPGLNVALIVAADYATGATISFSVYGASHTYQVMSSISTLRGSIGALSDASIRLALRYE